MKLVIVHYHFRPGGVRRIIELATPHILRAAGNITRVTLAGGEPPDKFWREKFQRACGRTRVNFFHDAALGYHSELRRQPDQLRRQVQRALGKIFSGPASDCVVWAHNLGLARNLFLTEELTRLCEIRHITLLAHHHDWWFDNRWQRWPELRAAGFSTMHRVAKAIFGAPHTRHLTINHSDASVLRHHAPDCVTWLPNLTEPTPTQPRARVQFARRWLKNLSPEASAIWLLPCRLLRRKNVAEALLLTRWLRPDACLVTTGGISSADEKPYFEKLRNAARKHRWPLHLGVLAGDRGGKPDVCELLAASEAVLLTSVQEGFGLPYLEAAAVGRPLIARALPNIAGDLAKFGFTFPQYYDEIQIHPGLFDWAAEQTRQKKLFSRWLRRMPASIRSRVAPPELLSTRRAPASVPFSRLTLAAQLEVLAHPAEKSWEQCAPLNRFLPIWRERAIAQRLEVTQWPERANRWLSARAYAARFLRALRAQPQTAPVDPADVQQHFIEKKLAVSNLYPLLWSSDT